MVRYRGAVAEVTAVAERPGEPDLCALRLADGTETRAGADELTAVTSAGIPYGAGIPFVYASADPPPPRPGTGRPLVDVTVAVLVLAALRPVPGGAR
jgi:hypothetical protein